jgi:hypothetical protein
LTRFNVIVCLLINVKKELRMEIFVAYFWIIKVLMALATIGVAYKLYKSKWKSKFWWVVAIAMVIFQMYNPVKMDLDTRSTTNVANKTIQEQKVLPEKVANGNFEKNSQNVSGITEEDLK